MKDKYYPVLIGLLLILGILIAYWPVQHFEFINYDDDIYVTENVHVSAGLTKGSVLWSFTADEAGFWHPLTWLSLMLDYEIYRLNAGGYHWTNVLFHLANTLLLFLVLNRMTGALWKSGFVAALFALHPLHVESVAWVSQRKDVLSTFFWMATMTAYVFYTERPGVYRYLLILLTFILGLMSKPMLITLPFVLLLLDYWPLCRVRLRNDGLPMLQEHRKNNLCSKHSDPVVPGRLSGTYFPQLVLEKIPFIVLAIIASAVTYFAEQKIGALKLQEIFPLDIRLANALISYSGYICKMIWPVNLSVYYPHPGIWPIQYLITSCLVLGIVTLMVIRALRTYPYLAVGWLWFLGSLVPVIGFIQVGSHAMADRYTYISLVGLFIMITWGVPDILRQWHYKRPILLISAGFVLVSLIICTGIQVKYWENGISLFQHAIDITEGNSINLNNLGNALARKGRIEEAITQYHKALRLQPDNPEVYNNIGNVLGLQGKFHEAVLNYSKALQLHHQYTKAHFNIGVAYYELGQYEEAIFHYSEVLRIKPDFVAAYNNLGIIYARQKNFDKAILNFRKAIKILPSYDSAKNNLTIALQQKNAIK